MSSHDLHRIELTDRQRDILLDALSYVRSSIKLRKADPSPEVTEERLRELEEIAEIQDVLVGVSPAGVTV